MLMVLVSEAEPFLVTSLRSKGTNQSVLLKYHVHLPDSLHVSAGIDPGSSVQH